MMSLEQWLQNAWLSRKESTVAEIQQLFQVSDREFADAQVSGLSADGQFQHAYNAALQLCNIPLRASGYLVTKGQSHHKRTIESIRLTLGKNWDETADYMDRCSRVRGQAYYERVGTISEEDARELLQTVQNLRREIIRWLRENYPNLLPPKI